MQFVNTFQFDKWWYIMHDLVYWWLITPFLLWKIGVKYRIYRRTESAWNHWHDYYMQRAMLTAKETADIFIKQRAAIKRDEHPYIAVIVPLQTLDSSYKRCTPMTLNPFNWLPARSTCGQSEFLPIQKW